MARKIEEFEMQAIAVAAHEVNRAYCVMIGDETQVTWDAAPEWQKQSAITGVRGVLVDGNGPEQSHESWLKEKTEAGWKYGPVKDPDKKEHPCFVPYAELSAAQKKKDALFVATVLMLGAAQGFVTQGQAFSLLTKIASELF
jgi:hypothetical protein